MIGWVKGRTASAALLLMAVARAHAAQPIVRMFTTEDGLARNWIGRIRPDRAGRLWFCTVEGLSVFDGERFTNYTVADGLPYRDVSDFLDSGNGVYWVVTRVGLYRFEPRSRRSARPAFTQVPIQNTQYPWRYASEGENAIRQMRSGRLYLSTSLGLYLIEQRNGAWEGRPVPLALPTDSKDDSDIRSTAEDRAGNLWIIAGRRLIRLEPDGRTTAWTSGFGMPEARNALAVDRDGRLWVGGLGIAVLDIGRAKPSAIARYSKADSPALLDVHDILPDSDGNIWVGGFGLAKLTRSSNTWSGFASDSPLHSQNVHSIASDIQGNLWATVSNMGAARILRHGFSTFTGADGLASKMVFSVFEAGPALFAITEPGLTLHEFDGSRFISIPLRLPARAGGPGWGEGSTALRTRSGEWWVAAAGGLVRYPRVSAARDLATAPAILYGKAEGLPFDTVIRLFEEKKGAVWVTGLGAVRWDPATDSFHDFTTDIHRAGGQPAFVLAFSQDSSGQVWLGLDRGGVLRLRSGRFERVADGIPPGQINFLLTDRAGRLWIATSQGGLARIDDPTAAAPRARRYSQSEGLASNHLFAIAEDHAGRIYTAGGQGVDRLDPATGVVRHYLERDGLPPGETQRMYRDRHGAIWFASNAGLSRYEPESDTPMPAATPAIHSVRAAGTAMLVSDDGERRVAGLELAPGKDDIEIDYGSVDFSAARGPRYQYRLLPVDDDWRQPTSLRSVQYARLGAARYTFEVRGVNSDGHPSDHAASVQFRILPPVWQRWWFALGLGCALVGLAYSAHAYRLRHVTAVQKLRTRVAADLHDDLGSGLAEIAILAEIARREASPKEAEVMGTVAERARDLRATMGDIVWSVDPACDNLTGVVRRWRHAAATLLEGVSLSFDSPPESSTSDIAVLPDRRRHLLLIFKEALTNIARHANAAHVAIEVTLAGGILSVRIRDDGRGFDPAAESAGNGLRSMRHRIEELHGALDLRSAPGAGATVELRLPV